MVGFGLGAFSAGICTMIRAQRYTRQEQERGRQNPPSAEVFNTTPIAPLPPPQITHVEKPELKKPEDTVPTAMLLGGIVAGVNQATVEFTAGTLIRLMPQETRYLKNIAIPAYGLTVIGISLLTGCAWANREDHPKHPLFKPIRLLIP